jgi:hypothetical protein
MVNLYVLCTSRLNIIQNDHLILSWESTIQLILEKIQDVQWMVIIRQLTQYHEMDIYILSSLLYQR